MMVRVQELPNACIDFLRKTSTFYDVALNKNPKVILVDSRAEFNDLLGKDTPSWMAATVFNTNILIFTKDKIQFETTHKADEFEQLINHELCHLLFYQKCRTNQPLFLNEGLACYLSGQQKSKEQFKISQLFDMITSEGFNKDPHNYVIAYNVVKLIMDQEQA